MTQKKEIVIVTDTFDPHTDMLLIKLREMGHQPVRLHPVAPASVQPRRKHQPRPFHMVPAPADAAGVGLALDRVELVPAFEPNPAGLAQQQLVGGAVGAAGQGLDDEAVQMLVPARRARTAGRSRAARTPKSRAGCAPPGSAPSGRDHRGAGF